MNPYEPAIGNSLIKFLPDVLDSTALGLHRELVSLWLIGSINDDAYMSTVKHLVDPPVENNIENSYADFEITIGFIIY